MYMRAQHGVGAPSVDSALGSSGGGGLGVSNRVGYDLEDSVSTLVYQALISQRSQCSAHDPCPLQMVSADNKQVWVVVAVMTCLCGIPGTSCKT